MSFINSGLCFLLLFIFIDYLNYVYARTLLVLNVSSIFGCPPSEECVVSHLFGAIAKLDLYISTCSFHTCMFNAFIDFLIIFSGKNYYSGEKKTF